MWKKIDSAPKDGSFVLLLIEDSAIEGRWLADAYDPKGKWEVISLSSHGCGCCSSDDEPPTHWMALPEKGEADD